ncbi:hypothetical protein [Nesterenkonia populi]
MVKTAGAAFRLQDGTKELVLIDDLESKDDFSDTGSPSYESEFQEIFSSPGARSIKSVNLFLHLLAVEVDPNVDLRDFNHWYDEIHVPAVATGGMTNARRFCHARHPRRFLALYEVDRLDVLESPELEKVKGFGPFAEVVHIYDRVQVKRV